MHTNSQGRFTQTPDVADIQAALLVAKLRTVLETPMDANGGQAGVTGQEQMWAVRVGIARPQWALNTLKAFGL